MLDTATKALNWGWSLEGVDLCTADAVIKQKWEDSLQVSCGSTIQIGCHKTIELSKAQFTDTRNIELRKQVTSSGTLTEASPRTSSTGAQQWGRLSRISKAVLKEITSVRKRNQQRQL